MQYNSTRYSLGSSLFKFNLIKVNEKKRINILDHPVMVRLIKYRIAEQVTERFEIQFGKTFDIYVFAFQGWG